MQKINKRQGLMLCAAGLLVVVMLIVFARAGARALVKRAHMENIITRTILYGNAGLQRIDAKAPLEIIEWERAYPFADIDGGKNRALPTKKIESKTADVEKRISEWTGKKLLGYYKLVEAGRDYEARIGWGLSRPDNDSLLPMGNGEWTFCYPRDEKAVLEKCASLSDLAQTVAANGGQFLYIQAPHKVDPYGDLAINGRWDFSNQNCDDLLGQLQEQGISTIDLRQNMHHWAQAEHISYHDYFFRTDNHWKPETALRAAKVVGDKLREYGIPVDDSHYNLQDFDVEVLPDFFLGSQGKRATLAKTSPDDFSILHPKFPTEITLNIPEKSIHATGNFELTYDKRLVEIRDLYNRSPYHMYGHGDVQVMDIENLLMPPTDKKVLIIRDSFCDTMAPFLSLGIRNLMTLDVRHFTGSVKTYIAVHKPDVVIVMYTVIYTSTPSERIDWSSHKDKYDFR